MVKACSLCSAPSRTMVLPRLPSLLLLLFLLLFLLGCSASAESESGDAVGDWRACIRDMGRYFVPINTTAFGWKLANPCKFRVLGRFEVRRNLYFPSADNTTFSFAGDSTALRAYIRSVNEYHPPARLPITKVAMSPAFTEHRDVDRITGKGTALRYFRLMYMSLGESVVADAISSSNGGMFVLMVGNWDLNWKLQQHMPMPGLVGGPHNFTAAQQYWVTYVHRVLQRIKDALLAMPPERRPIVMFREQFLPNCDAPRFASKKRRYRQCAPLVRPHVVPLYRRVLAPLAWALNIPVLPMDHLFRDAYRYCKMSDGIHLDAECMLVELQHIWNAYALLRRSGVVQGGLPDVPMPRAADFTGKAAFQAWAAKHRLLAPPPLDNDALASAQDELLRPSCAGCVLNTDGPQSDGGSVAAPPSPSRWDTSAEMPPPPTSSQREAEGSYRTDSASAGGAPGTFVLATETSLWVVVALFFLATSFALQRGLAGGR